MSMTLMALGSEGLVLYYRQIHSPSIYLLTLPLPITHYRV